MDVLDNTAVKDGIAAVIAAYARIDVLINNAAISNTSWEPGMSIEDYARTTHPSVVSFDEIRAVYAVVGTSARLLRYYAVGGVVGGRFRKQHFQRVQKERENDEERRAH